MKFIKLIILLSIFSISPLLASEKSIFHNASKKYNLPIHLLKTIATLESRDNRYAIGVIINNENTVKKLSSHLDYKRIEHKIDGKHVSIYPEKLSNAYYITKYLRYMKIKNYGVGLMQISSGNIKRNKFDELELLSNVQYNIEIGTKILSQCFDRFDDVELAIECYNQGNSKKKLNKLKRRNELYYYKQIASLYYKGKGI